MYTNEQIAEFFGNVRAAHFPDAQTKVRLTIQGHDQGIYEYYIAHGKSLKDFKIPKLRIDKENRGIFECICENGLAAVGIIGRGIRGKVYARSDISPSGQNTLANKTWYRGG